MTESTFNRTFWKLPGALAVVLLAGGTAAGAAEPAPAAPPRSAHSAACVRAPRSATRPTSVVSALVRKARDFGEVGVIAGLDVPFCPDGSMSDPEIALQRAEIAAAQDALLLDLAPLGVSAVKRYASVPYVALRAGPEALARLLETPLVTSLSEDRPAFFPSLDESIDLVQGVAAAAWSCDASNQVIAILDTGIDRKHDAIAYKVIAEACFSKDDARPGTVFTDVCPGAVDPGDDCPDDGCWHGTHVASIAAGNDFGGLRGVAPGADLISIQVNSLGTNLPGCKLRCTGPGPCNGVPAGDACTDPGPCKSVPAGCACECDFRYVTGATVPCNPATEVCAACDCATFDGTCLTVYQSDVDFGLSRLVDLADGADGFSGRIAVANLSLGGGLHITPCDGAVQSTATLVAQLTSRGIAVVAASGNNGNCDKMNAPACIGAVASVGATYDANGATCGCSSPCSPPSPVTQDAVISFSNSAPGLDFLAPGSPIDAAARGTAADCRCEQGTSMAAPHVAGAIACVRASRPEADVAAVLERLRATGKPVVDTRQNRITPRIQVDAATCIADPIHWWPLDEGGPMDAAADITGGLTGARLGSVTTVPGVLAGALRFEDVKAEARGVSTAVRPFDYATVAGFTLAAWVRFGTAAGAGGPVLSTLAPDGSGVLYGYLLDVGPSGPGFLLKDPSSATFSLTAPAAVNDGSWYLVAATVDYADPTNGLKLWVGPTGSDPAGIANVASAAIGLPLAGHSGALHIGWTHAAGSTVSSFGKGRIDEVIIFDRALTAPELTHIVQSTAAGVGPCRPATGCYATVQPADYGYARFEAPTYVNACVTDADCRRDGCSGEVCLGFDKDTIATTCEAIQKPVGSCGCLAGTCVWRACSGI